MSNTLANIKITSTPQKLSSLNAAMTKGAKLRIENIGGASVRYSVGPSAPADIKEQYKNINPAGQFGYVVEFSAGMDEIWLWTSSEAFINAELA